MTDRDVCSARQQIESLISELIKAVHQGDEDTTKAISEEFGREFVNLFLMDSRGNIDRSRMHRWLIQLNIFQGQLLSLPLDQTEVSEEKIKQLAQPIATLAQDLLKDC
jgi:hypothetical protein